MTVCQHRSEQKLADDIWPPPLNARLFSQLAQPFLASLVAAGHDIVEARKTPDKVCVCVCWGAWGALVLVGLLRGSSPLVPAEHTPLQQLPL